MTAPRGAWRPGAALALGLLALGLVISRPLPRELLDGLPVSARAPVDVPVLTHAAGDALQLYYQLWLVRDGLVGRTPLARDPYQFRIDGPRWNLPQTFPPLALPFTLFSVLGSHAAYNLLVLLSFPLAGLGAFGLVRHYTGHALAGTAAGVAFALAPARLGPLFGGQPAGFAAAMVPFVFWGLDVALTRGRVAGGVGGGLALLALATLEPHYTYLVGGLVLLYAPLRVLTTPACPRRGSALAPFVLLAGAGAGWLLMLRQALLVGSIAEAGRSLVEVGLFSPGPAALLVPAAYGGVVVLALAVAGLAGGGRPETPWLRLFFGATLAAGLLLSLGPTVPRVPVYQALHRWAPLFAMIRNPEKFRILVTLGGAVLAGRGVAWLRGRLPARASRGGGLLVVALVALDTAPWHGIAVSRFPDAPAYARLRATAGKTVDVPIWPGDSAWSSPYLYAVTRTRVPTINGYSPLVPRRYVREVYQPLQGLNVGDLEPGAYDLLRRLGVTHVVVDRAVFAPPVSPFPSAFTIARLAASPALVLEGADDPLWIFRVTGRPPAGGPPPPTSPVGVFYEAEDLAHERGAVASAGDASGGRFWVGRPGAAGPGFLTFGPYRLLPAGAYRATFRVRGAGLTAEVTTDRGRQRLGETAVPPSAAWTDVAVTFSLDRAAPVELRVRWDGREEAAVDWVLVVFADRPDPEWTFEVEALPHRLGERPDPAASGGWAGYADPGESLHTDLVTGPARRYPAGRYRLALRARAESAVRGPLVRLSVTEPAGRTLATRVIDGRELAPGVYRDVALEFRLGAPAVLEFPVGYLGGSGVLFDRLRVSATGGP